MGFSIFTISKVSKLVATLGTTFCLFIGTVLFYEGVPFLNWWPLNKIPVYGWFVEGEINRRSESIVELSIIEERAIWSKSVRESLKKHNLVIDQKNSKIRSITEAGLSLEETLSQQHDAILDTLGNHIKLSNQESTNEICHPNPLQLRIPSSVYDSIR